MFLFRNRQDAGQRLAQKLSNYVAQNDVIVLALPRGGVGIGYEISKKLQLPLDVLLVRKIGVPGQEELAMGAIASGNIKVFNDDIIQALDISSDEIKEVIRREQLELKRRDQLYRGDHEFPDLKNKIVILVDDGIATGATMKAAIAAVKALGARKIIVATPVAALSTCKELQAKVDEIICLETPEPLYGIGMWYAEFPQLTDEEVIRMLQDIGEQK